MSNFKNGNNFKDVTSLILKASTYMDNNEYNNALDLLILVLSSIKAIMNSYL